MSYTANNISEAVQRLSRRDPTLIYIHLLNKRHTDEELTELIDCLLEYSDGVKYINLGYNRLTDEIGIKLARYLIISNTIVTINLSHAQFGEATYLALATALRVNTSLKELYLHVEPEVFAGHVESAFVDALILNPNRPINSRWWLHAIHNEYPRLKLAAEQLGHPNMQALLNLSNSIY